MIMLAVMPRPFSRWMKRYAERKEREMEEELRKMDEEGALY
ncbi:hypothetical protein [Thermococcus celer]|nr:hypothetical protein [Thermococcus celer]